MRKLGIVMMAALLASAGWLGTSAWAAPVGPGPAVHTHAETHSLIDVNSGRILTHNGGDKRMRIASLTKVMTAIVAIENGKLSDIVKVSSRAAGKEGSSIYLRAGEEMSLHNMLYGLMLRSGNDAATAIAEHIGGTEEGFVYLMNRKAEELGLVNSQFRNPSGLDADGHYSSANDMARLTAYSLQNPIFQEIVRTKLKRAPNPNESWDYIWHNKNKMLSLFPGADGVKTGFTKLAHRTLISSASRDGQQLAAVTLNDGNDWADHAVLFTYGFQHFRQIELIRKGDMEGSSGWVAGNHAVYPLLESETGHISKRIVPEPENTLEYRFGLRGRAVFQLKDQVIASVPLYEPGSPRLAAAERSAFKFADSPVRTRFADCVRIVWKALVMVAW